MISLKAFLAGAAVLAVTIGLLLPVPNRSGDNVAAKSPIMTASAQR